MDRGHVGVSPGEGVRPLEPRPHMSEDDALIERVRRGDSDAFAQLYDHHAALVYGIARRILGNPAQAEDVAQSVFLQVWSRPASFQGGNFAGWLATVARNASIDVLRSAAVRTRAPEMPADLPSDLDLDDEVYARVRASAVADALAALPPDQREPIVRAYFDGLSYREVAEQLGTPLGTIKSRIRAGLRRLMDVLGEVEAI
jgi:RNA polymerase sigma-70 factor, ECF subfamily